MSGDGHHAIAVTCNEQTTRRNSLIALGKVTISLMNAVSSAYGAGIAADTNANVSLAAFLSADPRFTIFVRFIRFAGLGLSYKRAHDLTVFAPTNAAFNNTFPHWRTQLVPDQTTTGNAAGFHRQEVVKSAVVRGVHPPTEFIGKVQMVRSVGGTVFQVDGRTPGVLLLTLGSASSQTGIGFDTPGRQVARLSLPPIQRARFVVYPADTIIVPHN